ncbi:hypothetical protein AVEN_107562-1 [Araneus ventricosus]|uniref:Uncharacterized protein n=1 Tax=Araneus ventricosus TaxID=182803 RepID=A0A4Y2E033_ARAVE|nr:hypothetical protein AVEN_107562-1 [Araneus ventricosus]
MKVLVIGDFIIKYLSELLSQSEIEVRSFPRIRIEGLSLSLNSCDIILIHVGTDSSTEDLSGIVQNFDCLFDTILALNPKLEVLISGVISRLPNRFRHDFGVNDTFWLEYNKKIKVINSELKKAVCISMIYFLKPNSGCWKGCFGKDGLHLNFKSQLQNDFLKQLASSEVSTSYSPFLNVKAVASIYNSKIYFILIYRSACICIQLLKEDIMTDDDQSTFEAFNAVFGPSIRHLLCKRHVLCSWSRQLHAKASDKQLVKEMNLRLRELLSIQEKDAFEKLVEFENVLFVKKS